MSNVAPTTEQFLQAYPQFQSYTAPQLEAQLAMSCALLPKSIWDELYSEGVMLDTAHNLFLDNLAQSQNGMGALQATVGPVNSVSAAGVSTGFSTPQNLSGSASTEWYNKTVYGQKFLRLRNLVAPLGLLSA